MKVKSWVPALLLFACLLLSSCATSQVATRSSDVVVENVPFYPQEDFQCGPASLAGVLNYWGLQITPEDIASEIFSKSARGTLTLDMALYTQRKGLTSLEYSGSMDDLKEKIKTGYPLLVLVDDGVWVWQKDHFMVVVGYNDQGVIVNSGRKEHLRLENSTFMRGWRRADFWSLLIKKK